MPTPNLTKALPVTHRGLSRPDGDRYVLGFAKTERGAMRILRRAHGDSRTVVGARVVRLGSRGAWEPTR